MNATNLFRSSLACLLVGVCVPTAAAYSGMGQGVLQGTQVNASPAELLRAARGGDVESMRILGKMLIEGKGVKRDVKNGVKWMKMAAEAGDAGAMLIMGDLYRNGTGVPHDMEKAVEYYILADENGNKTAAKRLNKLSLEESLPWWEKKVADGNKKATLKLMLAHATGDEIPQDLDKAKDLYELANKKWPKDTEKALEKLTEEQRTELLADNESEEEESSSDAGGKMPSWQIGVPQPTIDLRLAAEKNEHWKYEALIQKGADVNYKFSDGYRVIDFEMGSIGEGIDILLKYGADVNSSWPSYCESISNRNRNEFYSEYELNDEKSIIAADEFMYYLLKKGVKFEPDEKGDLPLHYAAINGWTLYAKHASGTGVINKQNKYGMTALAVVVNMLEGMISHRRHMESPTTQHMGARPIYNSAREKRLLEVLVILLQNGANPNIAAEKDGEGQINTPFTFLLRHWSDSEDIGAMVKALYNNGADPNTEVENGYTILDFLVLDSSVSKDGRLYIRREAIKFLVERGGKCRNREALSKLKNDPEFGSM